jgi:hypothetical protein
MWFSVLMMGHHIPLKHQNTSTRRIIIFMPVCGLFDAVSTSDYIRLNVRMISELRTGKDSEGSAHGFIQSTIPAFAYME